MRPIIQPIILTLWALIAKVPMGTAEESVPLSLRHTEFFLGKEPDILKGQPLIHFPQTTLHLGTLYQGQRVNRYFEFFNKGTAPLHIRSTHSSCGCLGVRVMPSHTIYPGQRGEVFFELDSSQFVGHVVRTLTLDSDSPNQTRRGGSTQVLTITADVQQELEVVPPLLSLGTVEPEFSAILRFQVLFKTLDKSTVETSPLPQLMSAASPLFLSRLHTPTQELKVLGVSTSSSFLQAHWKPKGSQGGAVEIHFTKPLPRGPLREHVVIWNTSSHMKGFMVPVVGDVFPHVQSSHSYLEFGVVEANKRVRRHITLTNSTHKPFDIKEVKVQLKQTPDLSGIHPKDLLHTFVEKTPQGLSVALSMIYPKGLVGTPLSRNASGTLVVKTLEPVYNETQEIRIPFFGVLKKSPEEEPHHVQ